MRCSACIQRSTNFSPVAASLWAISFSWWGKMLSTAPVCTSKCGPKYFMLIAEHSMCQPGRPGPQGESQVGSPGFAAFQRTKSLMSSFSYSSSATRSLRRACERSIPESRPYAGNVEIRK